MDSICNIMKYGQFSVETFIPKNGRMTKEERKTGTWWRDCCESEVEQSQGEVTTLAGVNSSVTMHNCLRVVKGTARDPCICLRERG